VDLTPIPVRISPADVSTVSWAEGMTFKLPRAFLEQMPRLEPAGPLRTLPVSALRTAVSVDDVRRVREHAAFTDAPPASARLPLSYQLAPAWARSAVASLVGRRERHRVDSWAAFPGWPLDLTTDLLADLAGLPRVDLGERTPVVLTHDIDSPEGLRTLVREFLPREEAAGARSASYIVPCGWTLDDDLLREIRRRGHELGVHGYDHSNRTPFASNDERIRRLNAVRPFVERYEARGYRAPSLLRTRPLLRDLAPRFEYDSSIPTAGGLFPVPNNGCATARPFIVEGITEIPLTLPRDGSLKFLGHSPSEMVRMWIDCAEAIARSCGVVVLLTHCEKRFSGNPAMLNVYERFIDYVRDKAARFAFSTPGELVPRVHAGLGRVRLRD